MIIIGIDPGINNIGICHFDAERGQVITTKILKWENSYVDMYATLGEELTIESDLEIAIEKPFFTASTLQNNIRTLEIIGLIKMLGEKIGVNVTDYSPATIKKEFTGKGRAGKEDIIKEVKDKYNLSLATSHEADAVAIAYTHYVKCTELYQYK